MTLLQLLEGYPHHFLSGDGDVEIKDVIYDSREVAEGTVFVCMPGANVDGHDFIGKAVDGGAVAVVVEKDCEVGGGVHVVRVESARRALAYLSAAFFGHPAKRLIKVGLTGTKGKTTTTYMLKAVLNHAGKKVGVIGSMGARVGEEYRPISHTTPPPYEIHKLFREMVDAGCEYVVMEVSSQGLMQERVAGIWFEYGVFTNFSPDHIGPTEHKDLDEYLYYKSLLFRQCDAAIVNRDDGKWREVLKGSACRVKTYGVGSGADLTAEDVRFISQDDKLGMRFLTKGLVDADVSIFMPGRFNVYNALVTMLTCHALGVGDADVVEGLANAQVKGRLERVPVPGRYTVMIDHAHNEASTRSVLQTIRAYEPKRIVCVYGAGGNRSKIRRYDMGEVAGELADLSVLTDDNPRDEEVLDIIEDIKVGLDRSNGKYIVIPDRRDAIDYAIRNACDGEVVLLLGKGHEDYQEVKGVKYHFDEREVVREVLQGMDADLSE